MASQLFREVLDAHGGLQTWQGYSRVHATIVSGGQLWDLKQTPQDPSPRRMSVATLQEWASLRPYGAADQYTDFTPERIAILRDNGDVVKERWHPAQHAEGKAVDAPWDALDRAYFNGYALWTYLTTPFFFALPGMEIEEIESWREGDEEWRGLRVTSPPSIATHSRQQDFYFGSDFLLRRHDYHVEASGGFAAAQYVYDHVVVQGISFPTKRRAFMRNSILQPIYDRLMVSIDVSDISLE